MTRSVSIRVTRTPMRARDITAALLSRGGVFLLADVYNLTQPIYVPSGAILEGVGYRTELRCDGDFPAIVFQNDDTDDRPARSRIARLRITRTNTTGSPSSAQTESDGVVVRGDDLALDDLWIEDCWNGVRFETDDDETGTPTSTGPNTLTDSTKAWTVDEHVGRWVFSGNSSTFQVVSNTATTLTLDADGATPESYDYTIFLNPDEMTPSDGVTLSRVRVSHSNRKVNTSLWGTDLANARRVTLRDCDVSGSQLDGIKVRRNVEDLLIDGGRYHENRQAGINMFASGNRARLASVQCDLNGTEDLGSAGIEIKTSWLNPSYGNVRLIEIDGCRLRANYGTGITINRDADAPEERSKVQHVHIRGGIVEANRCGIDSSLNGFTGGAGIYANGTHVKIDGTTVIRNLGPGVWVTNEARDVTIADVTAIANGDGMEANKSNIVIDGTRVKVEFPTLLGKEDVDVSDDAEFDALIAVTGYPILCQSTARDVTIKLRDADIRGHANLPLILTSSGAEYVADYEGEGAPAARGYFYGGVGSTYRRLDGGADTSHYYKEAGTADDPTGWTAK
jgi:hypothetical protein